MTTEQEILELFDQWNEALGKGAKAVADLYAKDGILLPTVSNRVCRNEYIERYFDAFLKIKPVGTINESHVRILDDRTAINSGIYTFLFEPEEPPVVARFTFVYHKQGDNWKIVEHHSSNIPN